MISRRQLGWISILVVALSALLAQSMLVFGSSSPLSMTDNGLSDVSEIKLLASDGDFRDNFGQALSLDGEVAVVGAYGDDENGQNSGSAYIYRWTGSRWQEESKLLASDAAELDLFGGAVAVSGDVVIVGARQDNDNGAHSGSAYIYRWNGAIWEEEAKLLASDASSYDEFGHSVAISGDIALVGADNSNPSAIYIYRWNGSSWLETAKLLASDGEDYDHFGHVVAISGDIVAVGAPNHNENGPNSGAAYLFRWNGSSWQEEAKLLASDGADEDRFGYSIALSENTVLIGAYHKDGAFTNTGAAYVFEWNGSSWQEEAILVASNAAQDEIFGRSVSISGDLAIIGASGDDHQAEDAGSAYVFRREGNNWQEQDKLVAIDGSEDDYFGTATSINNNMVMVGAGSDDDNVAGENAGSAYLYNLAAGDVPDISFLPASLLAVVQEDTTFTKTLTIRNSGTMPLSWQQSQQPSWVTVQPISGTISAGDSVLLAVSFDSAGLTMGYYDGALAITSNDPDEQEVEVRLLLKARRRTSEVKLIPDAESYNYFGKAVAVSGDVAVVGEDNDAYLYRWNGMSWQQEEQLLANDDNTNKGFGRSISVSDDVVIVGAEIDNENGEHAGAAYIFRWNGSQWQQEIKLLASDGTEEDHFGQSVAINGDVAVVGTYQSTGSAGFAYIYRWNGTNWQEEAKLVASDGTPGDYFGYSASVSGDVAVIGAYNGDDAEDPAGSAYVFRWNGTTWQEESKLLPSIASQSAYFGRSVSIDNDLIAVGALSSDPITPSSGAAFVYRFDGAAWQEEANLTTSSNDSHDGFGYAVAISGETLIVTAFSDNENDIHAGAAYLFGRDGEQWHEQAKLTADDQREESHFGTSAAIDGERALVGAKWHNEILVGEYAGAAYLYDLSWGHVPDIFVAPAIRQTVVQGETTPKTLRIGNAGTQALTWQSEGEPWLSTIPAEGTIAPNETLSVTLEFDATALVQGTYTGTLTITSDDPDESVSEIRILLRVVPPVIKLVADDGEPDDYFGTAVSISGNFALVGVSRDDDNGSSSGAVYFYRWTGSQWVEVSKLLASDGTSVDKFGTSVSLSGEVAIIGAEYADGYEPKDGAAYVYRWNGSSWVEEAKLIVSDSALQFGHAVSINGDLALVRSNSNTHLFRRDANGWQEEASFLGGSGGNQSIEISGDMVFIGKSNFSINGETLGAVLVYRWNGYGWLHDATLQASDGEQWDQFGYAIAVDGNRAIIGARNHNHYLGAAYIYRWDGETWQEESKLTASDANTSQLFGQSVSISGDIALVGAYYDKDNGQQAGAAYLFKWNGETWQEEAKLLAIDGGEFDHFGHAVSVNGHFALVGSPGTLYSEGYAGAAYLYDLSLLEPSALMPIPNHLSLGLTMGMTAAQPLMIANQGTESWDWEVDWDAAWLDGSATTGSIGAGEEASLTFTFDSSSLTLGSYSDTLTLNSNQPNSPNVAVPIELKVLSQITATPTSTSIPSSPTMTPTVTGSPAITVTATGIPSSTVTGSPAITVTATSIPSSTMTPTAIATVISVEQDIYLPLIRR